MPLSRQAVVHAPRAGLGGEQPHGRDAVPGGAGTRHRLRRGSAGDTAHRARQPVHQPAMVRAAHTMGSARQHGRPRPVGGQRIHRATVAQPQIRGHLPSPASLHTTASKAGQSPRAAASRERKHSRSKHDSHHFKTSAADPMAGTTTSPPETLTRMSVWDEVHVLEFGWPGSHHGHGCW
jgi:hypothetical protein